MGSVDYIVRFKGDYSALAKDMSKINAETKKLEDDEVIIKLDYDGNIKEFNKVFDKISKMHPELGIQFQYNVNKKMLDKELDKLEKLTSIKADIDERKVVDKLKNLGNDVKSSIQDGLSKEEVTKRLETFFGYYNTAVKAGAKNIDVDFSNIHDEIFKSFSSAADDIKEVYDEVWDINDNKKIELFTIDKSINDDLLATKNRIDDLNESLANLEKKGASKTKVPSQIKVLQDEIRIIKSDIEDMQEKLKNLSGDKFDEITEKVRDLEKALRDTSEKFDEVIKDKIEKIFSELDIGKKNSRLFADIGKKIIDSIIAGVKDSHSDEDLADILLNTVNSAFEGVVLNSVTDALINEVYQKMGDGLRDHKFEIANFDAKTDTLVGSIQDGLNEYTFSIDLGGTIKSLSSALDTSADNVRMSFVDAIKWMNQANEWQKNNRDARHERQLFFNTKTGQFSNPTVVGDRDSVSPKLIKSMVEYYKKQGIAFDTDLHTHPDVDFAAPSGFDGDFRKFFSSAFQDGIDKFIVMAQKELAVFDFSKLSSSTDEFKEFINNWISDNLKEIEQEIGKQDKLSDNDYIAKYLDKIYSNLRETIYKNLKSSTNEEAEISGAEAKKTSKAIFKDLKKNILTNPVTGNLDSQIIDLFSDIESAIKKELKVKQITNPLNDAIKDVFRRVGDKINSLKDEDELTPEDLSLKVSDAILDSGLFDKGQFADLSGELQYKIQKKIIDQIIGLFSIEHSNFNYKTDQQLNHEAGSMAMKEIMSSSSAAGKLLNQFVNYYSHEEFEKEYGSKLPTSSEQNQAEVSTSPTLSDDFQTQLQDAINKSGEYHVDISGQLINGFHDGLQKLIAEQEGYIVDIKGKLIETFKELLQNDIDNLGAFTVGIVPDTTTENKENRFGDKVSLTGYHGTRYKWTGDAFDFNKVQPSQLGSGMYFVDSPSKLKGFLSRPGSGDVKQTELNLEKCFVLTEDYISSISDINKILDTAFDEATPAKDVLTAIRNYAKGSKENSDNFRQSMLDMGYQGMYVGDYLANKNIQDELVVYDESLLKNLTSIPKAEFKKIAESADAATVSITKYSETIDEALSQETSEGNDNQLETMRTSFESLKEEFEQIFKDIFSKFDINEQNASLFEEIGKKIIDAIISGIKNGQSEESIKQTLETIFTNSFENMILNDAIQELVGNIQKAIDYYMMATPLKISHFDAETDSLIVDIQNGLNNHTFRIDLGGTIKDLSTALNTSADNVRLTFIDAINWMRQANEWQKVNMDITRERALFFNTKTGQYSNPAVVGDQRDVTRDLSKQVIDYYKDQGVLFDTDLHWHLDYDSVAPSAKGGDIDYFIKHAFEDNINKFVIGAQKEMAVFDFSKLASNAEEFSDFLENWKKNNPQHIPDDVDSNTNLFEHNKREFAAYINSRYEGLFNNIMRTLYSPMEMESKLDESFKYGSKEIKSLLTGELIDPAKHLTRGLGFDNESKNITYLILDELYDYFSSEAQNGKGFTRADIRKKYEEIFENQAFGVLSLSDDNTKRFKEDLLHFFFESVLGGLPSESIDVTWKTQESGSRAMRSLIDTDEIIGKFVKYYTPIEFEREYGANLPPGAYQKKYYREDLDSSDVPFDLNFRDRSEENLSIWKEKLLTIFPELLESQAQELYNFMMDSDDIWDNDFRDDFLSRINSYVALNTSGTSSTSSSTSPTLPDDFQQQLQNAIDATGEYIVKVYGELVEKFKSKLQNTIDESGLYHVDIEGWLHDTFHNDLQRDIDKQENYYIEVKGKLIETFKDTLQGLIDNLGAFPIQVKPYVRKGEEIEEVELPGGGSSITQVGENLNSEAKDANEEFNDIYDTLLKIVDLENKLNNTPKNIEKLRGNGEFLPFAERYLGDRDGLTSRDEIKSNIKSAYGIYTKAQSKLKAGEVDQSYVDNAYTTLIDVMVSNFNRSSIGISKEYMKNILSGIGKERGVLPKKMEEFVDEFIEEYLSFPKRNNQYHKELKDLYGEDPDETLKLLKAKISSKGIGLNKEIIPDDIFEDEEVDDAKRINDILSNAKLTSDNFADTLKQICDILGIKIPQNAEIAGDKINEALNNGLNHQGENDNQSSVTTSLTPSIQDEQEVVQGVADSESNILQSLIGALQHVIDKVDEKTRAFQEEGQVVEGVVQNELTNLDVLSGYLINLRDEVSKVSAEFQGMDVKINITDTGVDKVTKFVSALSKINNDKIEEKIIRVFSSLDDFAIAVNNIKINDNGILSSINNLLSKSKELENLASVLKESKKKIKEATKATKEKNEPKNYASKYNRKLDSLGSKLGDDISNYRGKGVYAEKYLSQLKEIQGEVSKLKKLDVADEKDIQELEKIEDKIKKIKSEEGAYSGAEKQVNGLIDKVNKLRDSGKYTQTFVSELDAAEGELMSFLRQLKDGGVAFDEINDKVTVLAKNVEDTLAKKAFADFKQAAEKSLTNLGLKIDQIVAKNSGMGSYFESEFKKLREMSDTAESVGDVQRLVAAINKLESEMINAGKTGKSFIDQIKQRLRDINSKYIAQYFSFQDILRYARQAVTNVIQLNDAFIELSKVSNTALKTLEADFQSYADIAKKIGGTITDTINATADWARMGMINAPLYGDI